MAAHFAYKINVHRCYCAVLTLSMQSKILPTMWLFFDHFIQQFLSVDASEFIFSSSDPPPPPNNGAETCERFRAPYSVRDHGGLHCFLRHRCGFRQDLVARSGTRPRSPSAIRVSLLQIPRLSRHSTAVSSPVLWWLAPTDGSSLQLRKGTMAAPPGWRHFWMAPYALHCEWYKKRFIFLFVDS